MYSGSTILEVVRVSGVQWIHYTVNCEGVWCTVDPLRCALSINFPFICTYVRIYIGCPYQQECYGCRETNSVEFMGYSRPGEIPRSWTHLLQRKVRSSIRVARVVC